MVDWSSLRLFAVEILQVPTASADTDDDEDSEGEFEDDASGVPQADRDTDNTTISDALHAVSSLVTTGMKSSVAVKLVAREMQLVKRDVYAAWCMHVATLTTPAVSGDPASKPVKRKK